MLTAMSIVPDSERRTSYSPATATLNFNVNFVIFDDADIAVFHDGVEVVAGWSVESTYTNGESTDAVVVADDPGWSGVLVEIVGRRRPRREDQFGDGRGVPARDQNLILNKIVVAQRENYNGLLRAIKAEFGVTLAPLPSLVDQADKTLIVNPSEDGFEFGPTVGDIAGAADAADAAILAAAQAALLVAGIASTTSLAIGVASKAFTVAAGLPLTAGTYVIATSDASPASAWMHGQITSYVGTTLTVGVTTIAGSGTHADWTIRISGPVGPAGAGTGDMLKSENLSGLADYTTTRTNLGLGALAEKDTAAFADITSADIASEAQGIAGTASKLVPASILPAVIAALGGNDYGDIKFTARSTAPALWLLCYGQAISRTTYSALFAAIGTAFGTGDGATTFNVPDLRGRGVVGKDNMGGTSANRLTTAYAGFDGDVLGAAGGDEREQAHTHLYYVGTPSGGSQNIAFPAGPNVTNALGTSSYGAGNSQNVQPSIVMNGLIYAGV